MYHTFLIHSSVLAIENSAAVKQTSFKSVWARGNMEATQVGKSLTGDQSPHIQ